MCALQVESWWVASVLIHASSLSLVFGVASLWLHAEPLISRTTQSINGLSRAVACRRNERLRSASDIVAQLAA